MKWGSLETQCFICHCVPQGELGRTSLVCLAVAHGLAVLSPCRSCPGLNEMSNKQTAIQESRRIQGESYLPVKVQPILLTSYNETNREKNNNNLSINGGQHLAKLSITKDTLLAQQKQGEERKVEAVWRQQWERGAPAEKSWRM